MYPWIAHIDWSYRVRFYAKKITETSGGFGSTRSATDRNFAYFPTYCLVMIRPGIQETMRYMTRKTLTAFEQCTRSSLTLPAEYELIKLLVQPTAKSDVWYEANPYGNIPEFAG